MLKWIALYLALLSVYALVMAYLIRHVYSLPEQHDRWFDHERFRDERALACRPSWPGISSEAACIGALEHPCSFGGDTIVYPLLVDFDADAVLATIADIEAL